MNINVHVVNAFVGDDGQGGNPAGVVLAADGLTTEQMQYIAHEVGASETAFLASGEDDTYQVRFFTPTTEVPLCGHATIATWALMNKNKLINPDEYIQKTGDGPIHIRVSETDTVYMQQPDQMLKDYVDVEEIYLATGLKNTDLDSQLRPQLVQRQLVVAVASKHILDQLDPDPEAVTSLSEKYDFFGIHLFVINPRPNTFAAVRNFCPRVGINEDAATGTANGAMLAYLDHNNQLPGQEEYRIEQGNVMGRPSVLFGKREDGSIWVGGKATITKKMQVDV